MNRAAVIARLTSLPPRQFHLVCGAMLLGVAAALWSGCLRVPLAQMRAAQAERDRLSMLPHDARALTQQQRALAVRVRALETGLGLASHSAGADQRQLELISAVNLSARAHGIEVLAAAPAQVRQVASFTEIPFDIVAAGSYQQIADWLADLELALPNAAATQLDLTHRPAMDVRDVRLRIAAYFPQEATP